MSLVWSVMLSQNLRKFGGFSRSRYPWMRKLALEACVICVSFGDGYGEWAGLNGPEWTYKTSWQLLVRAVVVLTLHRWVFTSLCMCSCTQADRRGVVCHLVCRGCGLTWLCVLEANARFPTEYDSKGYGLMRLAGHTLRHWPVSSRPCDRRTSRPALQRRLGGQLSCTQLLYTQFLHTHTQLFYAQLSHTHNSFRLIHHYILQLPHAHSSCTHNCFTLVHHTVQTHTHTTLPHMTLWQAICHTHTHTTWSHTIFHTHNFVPHSFHTLSHTTLRMQLFKLIDPPPHPLSFLPSPSRFNFCFCLLEEVDLRLPGPLTDSLVTGSLNDWLIDLLARCFTDSLSRWTMMQWFTDSLIHRFI